MTELLLNLLDENPDSYELRMEALKTMELVLKEAGGFPQEIRAFMETLDLPPEPPDPKVLAELARKAQEEQERLDAEAAKAAAAAAAAAGAAEGSESEGEGDAPAGSDKKKRVRKKANPKIELIQSDSRRGSLQTDSRRGSGSSITLAGLERRGSYYSEDVSKKATVAMVVDDKKEYDGNHISDMLNLFFCAAVSRKKFGLDFNSSFCKILFLQLKSMVIMVSV